jgi:ribosomal protein S18 acetylase RimI-like enzyme
MQRSASWVIRPADLNDRDLVRGLLDGARWRHQHLDWASALSLLDSQPYLMAEERGLPVGCLACPPDPPGVAWIRVFGSASGYQLEEVWSALWDHVIESAGSMGIERAAALSLHSWLESLLTDCGFVQDNAVLFMAWDAGLPDLPQTPDVKLRDLAPSDIEEVALLDHRAFQPIWRHSPHALHLALEQSSYARVALIDDEIVGYQLCTASAFGAHLARLAVDPGVQHRGLGRLLVADVLHTFTERGYGRVTVNTQADNLSSQALYKHLGFKETGQVFPVFELAF